MARFLILFLVSFQCFADPIPTLSNTKLYTSIASGCSNVDNTWSHPTEKVLIERGVNIEQVQLCNQGKYPIFHVHFPYDPNGQTGDYFSPLFKEMKKANGKWPYSFVAIDSNTVISVKYDKAGSTILEYEMFWESEPSEAPKSDDQGALPNGWREPTTQEATLEGDQLRTRSTNDFLSARADFDGDGKEDVARLLVSPDGKKYALFVMLGSGNKIQLDQKDVVLLKTMGVDVLPPKTYKTACGKGYACEEGDPKVLHLKKPGLLYFKDESAESVYFWPSSSSEPKRVWLSD